MLGDLSLVLEQVGPKASADDYRAAVVEQNVLGKPTQTTRKRTIHRLVDLYALEPTCPVFRLLRHFWTADASARPLLAYLAATARDPLLRESTPFVVAVPVGAVIHPTQIWQHLSEKYPKRFKPTTLLSTAAESRIVVDSGRLPGWQGEQEADPTGGDARRRDVRPAPRLPLRLARQDAARHGLDANAGPDDD